MMGVPASWGLATFGSRESATGGWFGAGAGFTVKGVTLNASQLSGPALFPSLIQTFTS